MPSFKPWITFGLKKARRILDGETDTIRHIINDSAIEIDSHLAVGWIFELVGGTRPRTFPGLPCFGWLCPWCC